LKIGVINGKGTGERVRRDSVAMGADSFLASRFAPDWRTKRWGIPNSSRPAGVNDALETGVV
jgi:hypothetical protein